MKLVKLILPVVILGLGIGGFMALKASIAKPQPAEVRERVWRVDTVRVTPAELSAQIRLYGTVESPRLVRASAPATAVVERMFVVEGQSVKAGDTLFQLDERDFLPQIEQIEAQISQETNRHDANRKLLLQEQRLLTIAQENEKRAETLLKKNLGSQASLDEARRNTRSQRLSLTQRQLEINNHPARLKSLEAQLSQLTTQLERSRLKAPFDALIVNVNASEGDLVRNGDLLASFYAPEDLEVRAQIPSLYETIVLDALADKKSLLAETDDGHFLALERVSAQASSRGVDALFRLQARGRTLIAGQQLNLYLSLPPDGLGVAIPASALYGNDRIYLLQEGRMQSVQVERLGQTTIDGRNLLLVASDKLASGSEVIATHLPNAVDGLKVQADNQSGQAE